MLLLKKYLGLIISLLIIVVFAILGAYKAYFVVLSLFFLPVAMVVAFKGTKFHPVAYGIFAGLLFDLNDYLFWNISLNRGNPDYASYISIIFVLMFTSLIYGYGATAFFALKNTEDKKKAGLSILSYFIITSVYLYLTYYVLGKA